MKSKELRFAPGFYLFVCLFIHFYCCQLLALDPAKPIDQYLLNQWDTTKGLPSNTILSIAQTPDGYLWIATTKGLIRFDGITFSNIKFTGKGGMEDKKNTIPDALYVDKEGILWIGSIVGLTKYQYKTRQFTTFTKKDGLTGDRFRRIKEDMKGNLWLSFFASYLNRFADGTFTVFDASHGLEGKKINAIVEDAKGNLMFGCREKGVFKFLNERFFKCEIEGLSSDHLINAMYEDREGALWIGTSKGLFRVMDKMTRVYTTDSGLSDDYIRYIIEDEDRNLWVGTMNGLNRMKKEHPGSIFFETLLENQMILFLFIDNENSLWIGTYDSGLKQLKDGKFASFPAIEKLQRGIILSLFEDRRGDTWIGSLSGELYKCSKSGGVESLEIPGTSGTGISAIGQDGKGNLWFGTNGKGVFQRKGETFINFTTRNGLADNLVISIFNDSKDNLWISTYDGVSRYFNGVFESFKTRDGLVGKIVHNVYEDKDQHIRIASDKGINVIKNGIFLKNSIIVYLRDIPVSCIYEDNSSSKQYNNTDGHGNVAWIGTHGAGLKRFKNGEFISYTDNDGMTSNFIYQILEDEQENLWMMSDNGVLRVSKKELNQFANRRVGRINCTSFGISDGMKSIEFANEFSRHSALITREREFWFITNKGITIVNPGKIKINKFPPPVVIEEALFNDRASLFHFTAPTFLSPGKIKFKYRLEGYDRDWVFLPPGEKRTARYTNLAPGTYTFRVSACNSDGVWNRTGAAMPFTLKPYFYETFLFKISVFLILLLLAAAGYLLYKKRPFKKIGKYKHPSLNPLFVEECVKRLVYLMEIEKLYRDEHISLQSLSERLSISPHQLSQIINKKLDKNFSDFVNAYRIKEARRLLSDPKRANEKILAIAVDVGFNTRAAFNYVFKKFTKMTPSEYRKKRMMKDEG